MTPLGDQEKFLTEPLDRQFPIRYITAMAHTALERLKAYRDKHFTNDYELADVLGLTRAHFSQIINGVRRPGLATAATIEDKTGIPASSWAERRKSRKKSDQQTSAETVRVA